MKSEIHPELHMASVMCACGNNYETLSTVKSIHVEICSKCHPFYTGKQKFVDTAGRVEKFKKRLAAAIPKKGKNDAADVKPELTPAPEAISAEETE